MKEFFRNIGIGLLCFAAAGVFATLVITFAIGAARYPITVGVTVGVPCLLASAWVIGRIMRM
jgi:hypothetical protein